MPSVTTKQGYGSRILNSIKGIGIGFLLFFLSFGVLFWNEGRIDQSKIAEDAIAISSESGADRSEAEGQLISAAGKITTDEQIGDGLFLKPGNYLQVNRMVETYAWVEETTSVTKNKVGGSTETTTEYDYVKKWVSTPANSSEFEFPEGHTNAPAKYENESTRVEQVMVGSLTAKTNGLDLPGATALSLNADRVNLTDDAELISSKYVYLPVSFALEGEDFEDEDFVSSYETPTIGDTRISYTVIQPNQEGTLFGMLSGDEVSSYRDKTDSTLYRFFISDAGGALDTLHKEYKTMLWAFRVLGFFLMWIGLGMILGPISVLLDVIPFLGSLSRTAVGGVTFLVALILSLITIFVSAILHSIVALVVILLVALGALGYFLVKSRKEFKVEQKKA
jgi:hypothetical protein